MDAQIPRSFAPGLASIVMSRCGTMVSCWRSEGVAIASRSIIPVPGLPIIAPVALIAPIRSTVPAAIIPPTPISIVEWPQDKAPRRRQRLSCYDIAAATVDRQPEQPPRTHAPGFDHNVASTQLGISQVAPPFRPKVFAHEIARCALPLRMAIWSPIGFAITIVILR